MRLIFGFILMLTVIVFMAVVQGESRDRYGLIFFTGGVIFGLLALDLCCQLSEVLAW